MKSRTTRRFRDGYAILPKAVQEHTRQAYRQFQQDPGHPGLQFKKVHQKRLIYSARIGLNYRAVGLLSGDEIVWYWIGTHAEYDLLLAQM